MFEDKIIQLLNKVFDSYIEGIDQSKLTQMNLWGGKIVLNSLHIRPDLLDFLELPFHLTFGFLGSVTIKIQIPLLTLSRKNLSLDISDVLILLTTKPESQWDPELFRDEYITNKIALLSAESLELVVNQLEGNGFIWNTALSFLETLEVSIHNIHLRVEDYTTNNNVAYAFGCVIKNAFFTLNLDKSKEKNVDLPFQALFTDNGKIPQSVKYRTIDLEGFGLYIDQLDPMSHVKSLFETSSTNINFNDLNQDLNKDDNNVEYKQEQNNLDDEYVRRVSRSFKRPRKRTFSSKVYSRLSELNNVHTTNIYEDIDKDSTYIDKDDNETLKETKKIIGHTNAIYTKIFSKILNYLVTSKHDPNCSMFSENTAEENNFNNAVWEKSTKPVSSNYNMNYSTKYSRNTNRIRTSNVFKHGFNVNRRKRGSLGSTFKSERFEDSYMVTNFTRASNAKDNKEHKTDKDSENMDLDNNIEYKQDYKNNKDSSKDHKETSTKNIKDEVLVSKSWRVYLSTFCSIKHKDKISTNSSAEIITNSLRRRHLNRFHEEGSQVSDSYMDSDNRTDEDMDKETIENENNRNEYKENKQGFEENGNRTTTNFESGYEELLVDNYSEVFSSSDEYKEEIDNKKRDRVNTDDKTDEGNLDNKKNKNNMNNKDSKDIEIMIDEVESVDEILDEFEKRRLNYPDTPVSNMKNLSEISSSSSNDKLSDDNTNDNNNQDNNNKDVNYDNNDNLNRESGSNNNTTQESNTMQDSRSQTSYENEEYDDGTSISYLTSHTSNYSMGSSKNEMFSSGDEYSSSVTDTSKTYSSSYVGYKDDSEEYEELEYTDEDNSSRDSRYSKYKENKQNTDKDSEYSSEQQDESYFVSEVFSSSDEYDTEEYQLEDDGNEKRDKDNSTTNNSKDNRYSNNADKTGDHRELKSKVKHKSGNETTVNFECKVHNTENELQHDLQTPTTIDTPSNIRIDSDTDEIVDEDEWTCITYIVKDEYKDKVNIFLEGLKKVEHNYILNTRDFKGLGSFYFCSYPILPSKKYTSCWSEWGIKYGRVHTSKNEYLPRCTIFLVFEDLDIIMSKEQIECIFNLIHNIVKYTYWISGIVSTFESPRATAEDERLYMEYWPQFLLSNPNIISKEDKDKEKGKESTDTDDDDDNRSDSEEENEGEESYEDSNEEESEESKVNTYIKDDNTNKDQEQELTNLDQIIMDYSELSTYRSTKVLSGKEIREFVSDFEILHSIPTIRILRNKASDGLNKLIRGFGKDPVSWVMGSNFNECITNLLFTNICSSYQPEDKTQSGLLSTRLHDRLQFVGGIYEIVSKQANNSGMISSLKKLCTQQTFTVDLALDFLFINSRIIMTNNMHTSTDETNVKGYILCSNGLHIFYQDTFGRDGSQFVEFEVSPFTIFSLDVSLPEKEKYYMEDKWYKEDGYDTQRTNSTDETNYDKDNMNKDNSTTNNSKDNRYSNINRCVCNLLSGNPCILMTCGDCSADPLKKNKRNLLSILLGNDDKDYLLPPVFYISSDYNHFRIPETSDIKLRLHVDSELFMHFPIIDELSHILRIYKYNMDRHSNTWPIKINDGQKRLEYLAREDTIVYELVDLGIEYQRSILQGSVSYLNYDINVDIGNGLFLMFDVNLKGSYFTYTMILEKLNVKTLTRSYPEEVEDGKYLVNTLDSDVVSDVTEELLYSEGVQEGTCFNTFNMFNKKTNCPGMIGTGSNVDKLLAKGDCTRVYPNLAYQNNDGDGNGYKNDFQDHLDHSNVDRVGGNKYKLAEEDLIKYADMYENNVYIDKDIDLDGYDIHVCIVSGFNFYCLNGMYDLKERSVYMGKNCSISLNNYLRSVLRIKTKYLDKIEYMKGFMNFFENNVNLFSIDRDVKIVVKTLTNLVPQNNPSLIVSLDIGSVYVNLRDVDMVGLICSLSDYKQIILKYAIKLDVVSENDIKENDKKFNIHQNKYHDNSYINQLKGDSYNVSLDYFDDLVLNAYYKWNLLQDNQFGKRTSGFIKYEFHMDFFNLTFKRLITFNTTNSYYSSANKKEPEYQNTNTNGFGYAASSSGTSSFNRESLGSFKMKMYKRDSNKNMSSTIYRNDSLHGYDLIRLEDYVKFYGISSPLLSIKVTGFGFKVGFLDTKIERICSYLGSLEIEDQSNCVPLYTSTLFSGGNTTMLWSWLKVRRHYDQYKNVLKNSSMLYKEGNNKADNKDSSTDKDEKDKDKNTFFNFKSFKIGQNELTNEVEQSSKSSRKSSDTVSSTIYGYYKRVQTYIDTTMDFDAYSHNHIYNSDDQENLDRIIDDITKMDKQKKSVTQVDLQEMYFLDTKSYSSSSSNLNRSSCSSVSSSSVCEESVSEDSTSLSKIIGEFREDYTNRTINEVEKVDGSEMNMKNLSDISSSSSNDKLSDDNINYNNKDNNNKDVNYDNNDNLNRESGSNNNNTTKESNKNIGVVGMVFGGCPCFLSVSLISGTTRSCSIYLSSSIVTLPWEVIESVTTYFNSIHAYIKDNINQSTTYNAQNQDDNYKVDEKDEDSDYTDDLQDTSVGSNVNLSNSSSSSSNDVLDNTQVLNSGNDEMGSIDTMSVTNSANVGEDDDTIVDPYSSSRSSTSGEDYQQERGSESENNKFYQPPPPLYKKFSFHIHVGISCMNLFTESAWTGYGYFLKYMYHKTTTSHKELKSKVKNVKWRFIKNILHDKNRKAYMIYPITLNITGQGSLYLTHIRVNPIGSKNETKPYLTEGKSEVRYNNDVQDQLDHSNIDKLLSKGENETSKDIYRDGKFDLYCKDNTDKIFDGWFHFMPCVFEVKLMPRNVGIKLTREASGIILTPSGYTMCDLYLDMSSDFRQHRTNFIRYIKMSLLMDKRYHSLVNLAKNSLFDPTNLNTSKIIDPFRTSVTAVFYLYGNDRNMWSNQIMPQSASLHVKIEPLNISINCVDLLCLIDLSTLLLNFFELFKYHYTLVLHASNEFLSLCNNDYTTLEKIRITNLFSSVPYNQTGLENVNEEAEGDDYSSCVSSDEPFYSDSLDQNKKNKKPSEKSLENLKDELDKLDKTLSDGDEDSSNSSSYSYDKSSVDMDNSSNSFSADSFSSGNSYQPSSSRDEMFGTVNNQNPFDFESSEQYPGFQDRYEASNNYSQKEEMLSASTTEYEDVVEQNLFIRILTSISIGISLELELVNLEISTNVTSGVKHMFTLTIEDTGLFFWVNNIFDCEYLDSKSRILSFSHDDDELHKGKWFNDPLLHRENNFYHIGEIERENVAYLEQFSGVLRGGVLEISSSSLPDAMKRDASLTADTHVVHDDGMDHHNIMIRDPAYKTKDKGFLYKNDPEHFKLLDKVVDGNNDDSKYNNEVQDQLDHSNIDKLLSKGENETSKVLPNSENEDYINGENRNNITNDVKILIDDEYDKSNVRYSIKCRREGVAENLIGVQVDEEKDSIGLEDILHVDDIIDVEKIPSIASINKLLGDTKEESEVDIDDDNRTLDESYRENVKNFVQFRFKTSITFDLCKDSNKEMAVETFAVSLIGYKPSLATKLFSRLEASWINVNVTLSAAECYFGFLAYFSVMLKLRQILLQYSIDESKLLDSVTRYTIYDKVPRLSNSPEPGTSSGTSVYGSNRFTREYSDVLNQLRLSKDQSEFGLNRLSREVRFSKDIKLSKVLMDNRLSRFGVYPDTESVSDFYSIPINNVNREMFAKCLIYRYFNGLLQPCGVIDVNGVMSDKLKSLSEIKFFGIKKIEPLYLSQFKFETVEPNIKNQSNYHKDDKDDFDQYNPDHNIYNVPIEHNVVHVGKTGHSNVFGKDSSDDNISSLHNNLGQPIAIAIKTTPTNFLASLSSVATMSSSISASFGFKNNSMSFSEQKQHGQYSSNETSEVNQSKETNVSSEEAYSWVILKDGESCELPVGHYGILEPFLVRIQIDNMSYEIASNQLDLSDDNNQIMFKLNLNSEILEGSGSGYSSYSINNLHQTLVSEHKNNKPTFRSFAKEYVKRIVGRKDIENTYDYAYVMVRVTQKMSIQTSSTSNSSINIYFSSGISVTNKSREDLVIFPSKNPPEYRYLSTENMVRMEMFDPVVSDKTVNMSYFRENKLTEFDKLFKPISVFTEHKLVKKVYPRLLNPDYSWYDGSGLMNRSSVDYVNRASVVERGQKTSFGSLVTYITDNTDGNKHRLYSDSREERKDDNKKEKTSYENYFDDEKENDEQREEKVDKVHERDKDNTNTTSRDSNNNSYDNNMGNITLVQNIEPIERGELQYLVMKGNPNNPSKVSIPLPWILNGDNTLCISLLSDFNKAHNFDLNTSNKSSKQMSDINEESENDQNGNNGLSCDILLGRESRLHIISSFEGQRIKVPVPGFVPTLHLGRIEETTSNPNDLNSNLEVTNRETMMVKEPKHMSDTHFSVILSCTLTEFTSIHKTQMPLNPMKHFLKTYELTLESCQIIENMMPYDIDIVVPDLYNILKTTPLETDVEHPEFKRAISFDQISDEVNEEDEDFKNFSRSISISNDQLASVQINSKDNTLENRGDNKEVLKDDKDHLFIKSGTSVHLDTYMKRARIFFKDFGSQEVQFKNENFTTTLLFEKLTGLLLENCSARFNVSPRSKTSNLPSKMSVTVEIFKRTNQPSKDKEGLIKRYLASSQIVCTIFSDKWVVNWLEYPILLSRSDGRYIQAFSGNGCSLVSQDLSNTGLHIVLRKVNLRMIHNYDMYPTNPKTWSGFRITSPAHVISDKFVVPDLTFSSCSIKDVQNHPNLHYLVSTSIAPLPFFRTIVLEILPQVTVTNDFDLDIWIREYITSKNVVKTVIKKTGILPKIYSKFHSLFHRIRTNTRTSAQENKLIDTSKTVSHKISLNKYNRNPNRRRRKNKKFNEKRLGKKSKKGKEPIVSAEGSSKDESEDKRPLGSNMGNWIKIESGMTVEFHPQTKGEFYVQVTAINPQEFQKFKNVKFWSCSLLIKPSSSIQFRYPQILALNNNELGFQNILNQTVDPNNETASVTNDNNDNLNRHFDIQVMDKRVSVSGCSDLVDYATLEQKSESISFEQKLEKQTKYYGSTDDIVKYGLCEVETLVHKGCKMVRFSRPTNPEWVIINSTGFNLYIQQLGVLSHGEILSPNKNTMDFNTTTKSGYLLNKDMREAAKDSVENEFQSGIEYGWYDPLKEQKLIVKLYHYQDKNNEIISKYLNKLNKDENEDKLFVKVKGVLLIDLSRVESINTTNIFNIRIGKMRLVAKVNAQTSVIMGQRTLILTCGKLNKMLNRNKKFLDIYKQVRIKIPNPEIALNPRKYILNKFKYNMRNNIKDRGIKVSNRLSDHTYPFSKRFSEKYYQKRLRKSGTERRSTRILYLHHTSIGPGRNSTNPSTISVVPKRHTYPMLASSYNNIDYTNKRDVVINISNDYTLNISLNGLGVCVCSYLPNELLYLSLVLVKFNTSFQDNETRYVFSVGWLQSDVHDVDSFFPTMLKPVINYSTFNTGSINKKKASSYIHHDIITNNNKEVINIVMNTKDNRYIREISLLSIDIQPININLDTRIIFSSLLLLDDYLSIFSQSERTMESFSAPLVGIFNYENMESFDDEVYILSDLVKSQYGSDASSGSRYNISRLLIGKIVMVINIRRSDTAQIDELPPLSPMIRYLLYIVKRTPHISDAHIVLNKESLLRLCCTPYVLMSHFTSRYVSQAMHQIYKVLWAVDLIGNPKMIFNHWFSALYQSLIDFREALRFVHLPPVTFLLLLKGISHFGLSVLSGIVDAFYRFTGSWCLLLNALALNSDRYAVFLLNEVFPKNFGHPSNVFEGLYFGAMLMGRNLYISLGNFVFKPVNSFNKFVESVRLKNSNREVFMSFLHIWTSILSSISSLVFGTFSSMLSGISISLQGLLNQMHSVPMLSAIRPRRSFQLLKSSGPIRYNFLESWSMEASKRIGHTNQVLLVLPLDVRLKLFDPVYLATSHWSVLATHISSISPIILSQSFGNFKDLIWIDRLKIGYVEKGHIMWRYNIKTISRIQLIQLDTVLSSHKETYVHNSYNRPVKNEFDMKGSNNKYNNTIGTGDSNNKDKDSSNKNNNNKNESYGDHGKSVPNFDNHQSNYPEDVKIVIYDSFFDENKVVSNKVDVILPLKLGKKMLGKKMYFMRIIFTEAGHGTQFTWTEKKKIPSKLQIALKNPEFLKENYELNYHNIHNEIHENLDRIKMYLNSSPVPGSGLEQNKQPPVEEEVNNKDNKKDKKNFKKGSKDKSHKQVLTGDLLNGNLVVDVPNEYSDLDEKLMNGVSEEMVFFKRFNNNANDNLLKGNLTNGLYNHDYENRPIKKVNSYKDLYMIDEVLDVPSVDEYLNELKYKENYKSIDEGERDLMLQNRQNKINNLENNLNDVQYNSLKGIEYINKDNLKYKFEENSSHVKYKEMCELKNESNLNEDEENIFKQFNSIISDISNEEKSEMKNKYKNEGVSDKEMKHTVGYEGGVEKKDEVVEIIKMPNLETGKLYFTLLTSVIREVAL